MDKEYQLGFELGKDVALSVAEIFAVLDRSHIIFNTPLLLKNILVVRSSNPKLMDISINNLGGTVKLFQIIGEVYKTNQLVDFISQNLLPTQMIDRINFGLSGYGVQLKVLYAIGKELKNKFVDVGLKARFVTSKESVLSSVIVKENKLIERGFECILIQANDKVLVGRTISVQNYKLYSIRDYDRPRRDDKNGMLPPKLAQIMINLAGVNEDSSIYDPFCGSGTVLQEALLLGYKDIFGSDNQEKQINDSRVNIKWLEQNFSTKKLPEENLFISDVLSQSKALEVDAIVAEGYLGEPVKRNLEKAKDDAEKLASFYLKALVNLSKMITKNGRIILAIPFYAVSNEYVYLPLLNKLESIGLYLQRPLPNDINIKHFGRENLTYRRENQFVGREILILSNKKTTS